MAELKGHLPESVDICGIEHRDAIGAAEDQTATGEQTGGTVQSPQALGSDCGGAGRGPAFCFLFQSLAQACEITPCEPSFRGGIKRSVQLCCSSANRRDW